MAPPTRERVVLVTGATGYVGSHLVMHLLEEDPHVRVRGSVRSAGAAAPLVELMRPDARARFEECVADLMDAEGWEAACSGCETVFHVASPASPLGSFETVVEPAVRGTINVMAAAARSPSVTRVVYTSSVTTLGPLPSARRLGEADWADLWGGPPLLWDAYARGKVAAELCAWLFAAPDGGAPMPREEILRRLAPPPGGAPGGAVPGAWLERMVASIRAAGPCRLEVVAVAPSVVLGPVLLRKHCGHMSSSADFVLEEMVAPDHLGQPPFRMPVVGTRALRHHPHADPRLRGASNGDSAVADRPPRKDVRDVVRCHVRAMDDASLAGRRILVSSRSVPLVELARHVRANFAPGFGAALVFRWPRALLPLYALTRLSCKRATDVAPRTGLAVWELVHVSMLPRLLADCGRAQRQFDTELARALLGGAFIDAEEMVRDTGASLVRLGAARAEDAAASLRRVWVVAACACACAACLVVPWMHRLLWPLGEASLYFILST